jgi:hypothetical protein
MALTQQLDLQLKVRNYGTSQPVVGEELSLIATHDELATHVVEVANGVTDQAISLGALTTAVTVLLISDTAITFKVNGAAVGVACKTLLLTAAAVTSLSVSNASGAAAVLRIHLLGT